MIISYEDAFDHVQTFGLQLIFLTKISPAKSKIEIAMREWKPGWSNMIWGTWKMLISYNKMWFLT